MDKGQKGVAWHGLCSSWKRKGVAWHFLCTVWKEQVEKDNRLSDRSYQDTFKVDYNFIPILAQQLSRVCTSQINLKQQFSHIKSTSSYHPIKLFSTCFQPLSHIITMTSAYGTNSFSTHFPHFIFFIETLVLVSEFAEDIMWRKYQLQDKMLIFVWEK